MSEMSTPETEPRVLVTGARGFIGRHLVERLAADGVHVYATSRRRPVNRETPGPNPVRWHQVDLADPSATDGLIRSVAPDTIFHLAGVAVGARDPALIASVLRGNLTVATNVMTAGLEAGVGRIVLAGSMEEPDPDDSALAPNSPYSAAKWATTGYARMFHELWDLSVTVLRVAMVYGPAQPDDRKLVPYVISALLDGRTPELTSGSRLVDWIYVGDVVDAFLAAAATHGGAGEAIPIGSGTRVSIRDVVDIIGSLIGTDQESDFGALEDRPMDRTRVADPGPAHEVLGWRAETSLHTGLMRTIRWHREQKRAARTA